MKEQNKTRRSFLLKTIGASAALAIAGWFGFSRKKKTETIKMLTQDGRLVEIDKNLVRPSGKKIKDEEIHTWVNNKSAKTKNN